MFRNHSILTVWSISLQTILVTQCTEPANPLCFQKCGWVRVNLPATPLPASLASSFSLAKFSHSCLHQTCFWCNTLGSVYMFQVRDGSITSCFGRTSSEEASINGESNVNNLIKTACYLFHPPSCSSKIHNHSFPQIHLQVQNIVVSIKCNEYIVKWNEGSIIMTNPQRIITWPTRLTLKRSWISSRFLGFYGAKTKQSIQPIGSQIYSGGGDGDQNHVCSVVKQEVVVWFVSFIARYVKMSF